MKKTTTLLMALAFSLFAFAQNESAPADENTNQTEKKQEESKETEGPRKYRSISVGADIGQSLLFGDFKVFEAGKLDINDKHNERGGFDGGFTVNLAKWYSTAYGIQGRFGWLGYSGTNGIYSFWATAMRADAKFMLNLSGIGGGNRHKERKSAWIVYGGLGYSWANAWVAENGIDKFKLGQDKRPEFISQKERDEKSHNTVYLPFGIEWRYRVGERWDIKVGLDNTWALDDNLDGSQTVVSTDWSASQGTPNESNINDLAFGNTTNDFLTYFHVGADFWFSIKDHDNSTPIIFSDGFSELDNRLDKIEDNLDKLMGDDDNDGVSNYFDKEPDTPEGYRVYGGGQAVDQDQDGIADDVDEDPYSTPDAAVDANGREMDDDGDGVPNSKDVEPSSKPGAFVNHQGVTIVDKIGPRGGQEAFLPSIYFDFDKSEITSANYQRLSTIARFLQANSNVTLLVVGHTDKVGGEQYNYKLSNRRAKATMMALINDFGIDASRLEMKGDGKTHLVSKRDDINRRAEFQIKK